MYEIFARIIEYTLVEHITHVGVFGAYLNIFRVKIIINFLNIYSINLDAKNS